MATESVEKEAGEDTNEDTEKTRGDEDEDDHSTSGKRGKHSKKHKHKHSKKHKHKHKKRKHKKSSPSRSRSKSSSRSRSRSPDSNEQESTTDVPEAYLEFYTSTEQNGTIKQESENKAVGLGEETEDVTFEETAQVEAEDFSFKLTKSLSPSPSATCALVTPTIDTGVVKAGTKPPDASRIENRINLGFPLKIGSFLERKSKSPDLSEQVVEDKKSRSPDNIDMKDRSPLPSDTKRSKAPESRIKKRSQSRSRSKSPTKTNSRKSRSKSPRKQGKRTSRSMSSSRSGSRSRSRHKRKSVTKSKSRSRSPQKHKLRNRSRSRSSSYSRKKPRKRERSHSRSRRSRSRSPRKKSRVSHDRKTRDRSGSPSHRDSRNKRDASIDRKQDYHKRSRRSRSHEDRYSRKSRSVTPPRSHRHRSHSRSPRRGRSRSPRRDRYQYRSRSRSRSGRYRHRSRSRSYSYRRRRSRSHSRSRSRDRHHRRSRSKSKEKKNSDESKGEKSEASAVNFNIATDKPTAQDLVGKAPTVTDPSNKRSLAELTEFCKKLTEARGIETEGNETENPTIEEEDDDTSVEISHPFLVAPKKDITIPPVLLPQMKLYAPPLVSSDKPLTEQFPVSCGTKHHEKEQEDTHVGQIIPDVDGSAQQTQQVFMPPQNQQKLDISGLVVKRMEAQRRLQADPNDLDAMLSLQEVEMKLNNWCQSNVKPGQFTGQLAKTMMPKEKMNSGYQAWAKKDMFHNLNPISGGIGMKLLQKMGWEPGQVLGKRGQGMVEPIALTVKVDRKGLSSNTEKPVGKKGGGGGAGNKPIIDLQGKHPISSLQEFCARRKWQVPEFTLIFDEGPPHSKQFLFKVAVNGYEYQHPVVSSNKKHAKAQAAVAALKGLGLVPENADY